jgi:hypothetical protein
VNIPTIHLVLLIAATWRLANLLANEDGPFHMFKALRSKIARAEVRSRRRNGFLSKLHLYEGVNCEYCNSIWFGTLLGWIYLFLTGDTFILSYAVLPLALSTGAILIKKVVFVLGGIDTRLDQLNNPKTEVTKVEAIKQNLRKEVSVHE